MKQKRATLAAMVRHGTDYANADRRANEHWRTISHAPYQGQRLQTTSGQYVPMAAKRMQWLECLG